VDQRFPAATGLAQVFLFFARNRRHRAAPRFPAQPAHQRRQQKIHVEAVGLGALAAPLTALECLTSGKINKATADQITDTAKLVIGTMRSRQESEPGQERRKRKVSLAVGELREAEEKLTRLSKPPDGKREPAADQ
jgi:hypothetical protein